MQGMDHCNARRILAEDLSIGSIQFSSWIFEYVLSCYFLSWDFTQWWYVFVVFFYKFPYRFYYFYSKQSLLHLSSLTTTTTYILLLPSFNLYWLLVFSIRTRNLFRFFINLKKKSSPSEMNLLCLQIFVKYNMYIHTNVKVLVNILTTYKLIYHVDLIWFDLWITFNSIKVKFKQQKAMFSY